MTICADEDVMMDRNARDSRIAASSIFWVAITEKFDEVKMESF